jgi:hypothetical protein
MLLGVDEGGNCTHRELSPAELAESLSKDTVNKWPDITRAGWQIFCHIRRIAEENGVKEESRSKYESGKGVDEFGKSEDLGFPLSWPHHVKIGMNWGFRSGRTLGHLWAAARTKWLTYHRLRGDDPWTSENFQLDGILQGLEEE